MKKYIYIDGANLHQGSKLWDHQLDYSKFFTRLQDKYKAERIFMFVGYIKGKEKLYTQLSQIGYNLIFKETLVVDGKVKGNCDAELVIQAVSDYFEQEATQGILITGDGDFGCLLDFYKEKGCSTLLLAPNKDFCSYLLKKKNIPIIFLEEICHKFGDKKETKKPKETEKKTKGKQKRAKRKYTRKPERTSKASKENKKKATGKEKT